MKLRPILSTLLLAVLAACSTIATPPAGAPPTTVEATAQVVPTAMLNGDVTQETIQQTICVSGYTATVRPSTNYTNGVKLKLMREQSIPASAAVGYELDHHIPLALGGHPRNLANLMLQPWEGEDGAKKKDRLERRLQVLVCAGKVRLNEARRAIFFNWQGAYGTYVLAP